MFWLWLIVAFVAGGCAGFYLTARAAQRGIAPAIENLHRQRASDQSLLLKTFRRELANLMIRTDPDGFVEVAKRVTAEAARVADLKEDVQRANLKVIVDEFPYFSDFDTFGGREHVLYSDTILGFEEAARNYRSIAIFEALKKATDPEWMFTKPVSSGDAEHLQEYIERVKDGMFLKRLSEAMRLFWAYRAGRSEFRWENESFTITTVPHFAETQWGVEFKDTGERGIFSTFYGR